MTTPRLRRGIALLTALALSGCGGGSGSSAPAGAGSLPRTSTAPSGTGQLALKIAIPSSTTTQSAARKPQYVSTATQSIAVTIGTGTATNINVTPTSTGCTSTQQLSSPVWQEFPIAPGAQPRGITVGPDSALWFNEDGGGAIGRMSITSPYAYTRYSNTRLSNDIVSTGGNLWVGDLYGAATLGNVQGNAATAGSTYAELSLGTASGSGPPQTQASIMAVGADGAIWFTEFDPYNSGGVSRIGRVVVPGGATTEIPTLTTDTGITSIPSDNAVWFVETTGATAYLGRISTATRTLTNEYQDSAVGTAVPGTPVAGGDGGIWFTDSGGFMNRFDMTTHAFTRFPTSTGAFSERIVVGADGALYFTEFSNSKIGRITTVGAFSEYTIPAANSFPFSMLMAPDGALWFAEEGPSNITRLTFPSAVACASTLVAPAGTQNVTVASYDAVGGASGTGHLLATSTTSVTIAANANNALNLTLNGVVASINLTSIAFTSGCPLNGATTLLLQAFDTDGNLIVAPGAYVDASGNPLTITLTDTDTSGHSALSATTFTGPPATQPVLTFTSDSSGATVAGHVTGGTISGRSNPSLGFSTNC